MKKLLIITQVVDRNHPILGFFHRWIEEFAAHCESVQVIALQVGEYDLPTNVTVHTLGKEIGQGRLSYLWRFYQLIYRLRHEYDGVFVHMNQIYVILGGLLWRLWGKRIGLWYMHGTVSTSLRLALKITHTVFTGSSESFRLSSPKVVVTGHGIDTTRFVPDPTVTKDLDCITVGRISRSKCLHVQIDLIKELPGRSLTIIGRALTEAERLYEAELRDLVRTFRLDSRVHFCGAVNQKELPSYLQRAQVFVHTATNGSLDKTVLEALACGIPVVSSAEALRTIPGVSPLSVLTDSPTLYSGEPGTDGATLSTFVKSKHSIQSLIPFIISNYK